MTVKILLSVIFGTIIGSTVFPGAMDAYIGDLINIGLCVLLFFVGVDIGRQGNFLDEVRNIGPKVFVVPAVIALGSIIGAMVAGTLLGMPINEAAAIGAGFGWYSFSAVELSKHSAELGALAFITNVSREVTALILIPFIAKHIGNLETIASAGATAMDTTLPLITKHTDTNTTIISFVTGIVLSILVPILVPMMLLAL